MKEGSAIPCHACGSTDTDAVATLRSEVDGKQYKAVTCNSCDLVFADPIPNLSFDGLQEVYGASYTEGLREPVEDPGSLRSLRDATNRQMDIVERYAQRGLALNVGAMSGATKVLEERGWKLQVVEPSRYAAETARERWGFDVTVSRIEDYSCPPNTFDFVKLGHVIEHLVDPRLALENLHRVLKPNGILLVDTDNARGLRTQIELSARKVLGERLAIGLVRRLTGKDLRKRYGRLIPPVHLYTFSERSLVRVLVASGFDVINVRKPAWGDPTWFPLTDLNSMSFVERAFILLDQIGAVFGSGDLIAVLARKRVG